jgi:hypothetical protein
MNLRVRPAYAMTGATFKEACFAARAVTKGAAAARLGDEGAAPAAADPTGQQEKVGVAPIPVAPGAAGRPVGYEALSRLFNSVRLTKDGDE